MGTSHTVADLIARLSSDPGRPRITWYAAGGERVELSGYVLENWVAKTTNLLVEEFDAAPGIRVLLDLPTHWKRVVWALAIWRSGATLILPEAANGVGEAETARPAPPLDVVVTSEPESWQDAPGPVQIVAIALGSLARSWDGELPPGIMDGVAEVPLFDDVLGWTTDPAPSDIAVEDAAGQRSYEELLNYAATFAHGPGRGELPLRKLVFGEPNHTLFSVIGVLSKDGSAVLLDAAEAASLRDDPLRRERLIETERITVET